MLPFRQVDVFSAEPWLGNPLAVVHDADELTDAQMAAFARCHPTIGSAHAWLEAGGESRGDVIVQECAAGLVEVRRSPPARVCGTAAELGADVEVRAFFADGNEFAEDPVTGSANAGLAQWLIGTGALPASYVARQGSVIDRDGRVHVEATEGEVWVSGDAVTRIEGRVDL